MCLFQVFVLILVCNFLVYTSLLHVLYYDSKLDVYNNNVWEKGNALMVILDTVMNILWCLSLYTFPLPQNSYKLILLAFLYPYCIFPFRLLCLFYLGDSYLCSWLIQNSEMTKGINRNLQKYFWRRFGVLLFKYVYHFWSM